MVAVGIVVVGVLLQAFSIAAYVRGAGSAALDMHETGGYVTHGLEIVAFLLAVVAFWGTWWRIGFPFLLPAIGTVQVFVIGDTNEPGGWVNGLHGFFALIVLLLAAALLVDARRALVPRIA